MSAGEVPVPQTCERAQRSVHVSLLAARRANRSLMPGQNGLPEHLREDDDQHAGLVVGGSRRLAWPAWVG